jgi:site-specific DNA recombinase
MREIRVIPASPQFATAQEQNALTQKRKVAGYARVSTDSEDQYSSYEAQVDYYTNMIKANAEWEFVGIYTDEGISGTSTARREGFRKMVDDALEGKIDLIITKSVSRFARNTVDSLSTIRKLKEHKVEVMFEKEGIRTFDSKGELLITIMSSLAQEESRSISENVKWGIRKRFADGEVSVSFTRLLGFQKGPDGKLEVNPEQAKIVKLIFSLFLNGGKYREIARLLEKEGYTTVTGNKHWHSSTIKHILTNEKYKGDALLQKYYTADFLARRPVINNGEIPQYYVKKNHEAIIDPKIFDLVQKEIKYRSGNWEMNMGKHIFSGRIKCGSCGANFGPKVWHSNQRYRKQIWQCNDKYIDRYNKCPTPHCTEELIKELFVKALNKLIQNKETLIKNFEEIKDEVFNPSQEKEQLNLAIEKRTNLITKLNQLTEENARVKLDQQIYQERYEEISIQYAETSKKITVLDETIKSKQYRKTKSELFLKELNKQKDIVTDFSDSLWISFVDYVTVYDKGDIRFTLKNGMEV